MTISAQLIPTHGGPPSGRPPASLDPHARRDRLTRRGRLGATERDVRRGIHDRPTIDLGAERPTTVSAFALLDHRTRSRAVALADAPPGRYLSAGDGEAVRLVPLDQPIIRIGRGLGADVRIEDPPVSRRHAIIAQRGGGARVLDDRSSNGTHVNGRPVTIGYLDDGDVLRIGRVVLRFVEIPGAVRVRPLRRFPLAVVARLDGDLRPR